MGKKYDTERLNNEGVIDFKDTLYRFDKKKSHAWICLPFGAVMRQNWDKETPLRIEVSEVKEQ